MAISRKALIPQQEGGIVLLSVLDVERKNLECSVSEKDVKSKNTGQRKIDTV